jgi:hypothetical protein
MLCAKKLMELGLGRQCATEITVDNSVDELGWGAGDSNVGLWPAYSPALTRILTS